MRRLGESIDSISGDERKRPMPIQRKREAIKQEEIAGPERSLP